MGNKGIQKDINGFIEIVDMEQRSREWFLARKGRMTASEIYLLLNNHKEEIPLTAEEQEQFRQEHPRAKMPETKKVEMAFSDGTFTWLNRKVAEYYMPDEAFIEDNELKQINNRAVQHGEFWESDARAKYMKAMGYTVYEVGFIPMKGFEQFAGGSPDGMIREEQGLIEIKCAWNPEVHQDYLLFTQPDDLKEYNLQYYVQCQMNMIVTDCLFCDFVAFDPRTSKSKQLKVLRIPKDEELCSLLIERITLAREYYKERMNKLDNIQTIIK